MPVEATHLSEDIPAQVCGVNEAGRRGRRDHHGAGMKGSTELFQTCSSLPGGPRRACSYCCPYACSGSGNEATDEPRTRYIQGVSSLKYRAWFGAALLAVAMGGAWWCEPARGLRPIAYVRVSALRTTSERSSLPATRTDRQVRETSGFADGPPRNGCLAGHAYPSRPKTSVREPRRSFSSLVCQCDT